MMALFTTVYLKIHIRVFFRNALCIFSIGFLDGWPLYLVDSVEDENGSCFVVDVNQVALVCTVNTFDVIDSTLRTREELVA